jgi:hypothetical protein
MSCVGQEIDPPFVMAVIICDLPATPLVIGSAAPTVPQYVKVPPATVPDRVID